MFDAIARRYDTLNHLLSAGLDRRWRRRAIRALALTGRERVLDVCTGTADLAIEAAGRASPGRARAVVGIDFAGEMLRYARDEGPRAPAWRVAIAPRARRRDGACRCPTRPFDAAMVAFGIRNVVDPVRGVPRVLPRAAARRAARDPRVRRPDDFPASARPTAGTSGTCCRASAGWSRSTARPIPICRPRCATSRPATRFASDSARAGFRVRPPRPARRSASSISTWPRA